MLREHPKVCILTSSHRALDTRIFNRQAISLSNSGYPIILIGQHEKDEQISSISIISLEFTKGVFGRLKNVLKCLNIALATNADIYHFHDPELIPVGLLIKLLGNIVIYDVHDDYQLTILSRKQFNPTARKLISIIFSASEKFSSKFFDQLFIIDSKVRNKFPNCRTELITNYPTLISQNNQYHCQCNAIRLVFLGVLSREHGVFEIVEALNYCKYKDITCHFIGSVGDPDCELVLKKYPRVFMYGRLPWLEAREALRQNDIAFFTYHPTPWHLNLTGEGNTKLYEYMEAGLPIIYSDFPNLRKLIGGIGCGIPVNPTDPEEIAQAINYLIDNPSIRKMMGYKGRKAVEQKYNWSHEEKKLLRVYSELSEMI